MKALRLRGTRSVGYGFRRSLRCCATSWRAAPPATSRKVIRDGCVNHTTPTIAVIAQGSMGAGVARRLTDNGVRVLTSLAGRSAASAARAKDAGMIDASDAEIAAADVILSIVPPGDALPFAQRLAPALTAATGKPLYADCNAVSPDTVKQIAAAIAPTGARFRRCRHHRRSAARGLWRSGVLLFGRGCRAAGTVERCRPGVPAGRWRDRRGLGAEDELWRHHQGADRGRLGHAARGRARRASPRRCMPSLPPASRICWPISSAACRTCSARPIAGSAEMEEIAHFTGGGPSREMYEAIADLYERLAADNRSEKVDIGALAKFFEKK